MIRGGPQGFFAADSDEYVGNAENLVLHHSFEAGGEAEVLRTPGYALLIAPGIAIGAKEAATIGAQVILGSLCVWFVYAIALRIASRPVALVAAGFYAIEGQAILYCSQILSETLFTCLLTASLLCLLLFLENGKRVSLAGAGLLLGAAIYVRPIAYFLPVVFALAMARLPRPVGYKRTQCVSLFLLVVVAVLGPWHVRNRIVAGTWEFSSTFSYNFRVRHAASVLAALQGKAYHEVDVDAVPPSVALEHPLTAIALQLRGSIWAMLAPNTIVVADLIGGHRNDENVFAAVFDKQVGRAVAYVKSQGATVFILSMLLTLQLGVYYILVLRGMAPAFRSQPVATAFLAVVAAYFLLAGGGQMASGRFRHPVMPVISIFAAIGLSVWGHDHSNNNKLLTDGVESRVRKQAKSCRALRITCTCLDLCF